MFSGTYNAFMSQDIPKSTSNMTSEPQNYEPTPNAHELTANAASTNSSDVDYEPYPDRSIEISPERQKVLDAITSLYSGSASEEDMQVYAESAIYDDPWSYCDTRYKIAGQWYGMLGKGPAICF